MSPITDWQTDRQLNRFWHSRFQRTWSWVSSRLGKVKRLLKTCSFYISYNKKKYEIWAMLAEGSLELPIWALMSKTKRRWGWQWLSRWSWTTSPNASSMLACKIGYRLLTGGSRHQLLHTQVLIGRASKPTRNMCSAAKSLIGHKCYWTLDSMTIQFFNLYECKIRNKVKKWIGKY